MWFGLAVGKMSMSAKQFWSMSPREFSSAQKAFEEQHRLNLRDNLLVAYYSGAMSQADLSKNKIDKFMSGIDAWLFPDKALEAKQNDLERLKKLWDSKIA